MKKLMILIPLMMSAAPDGRSPYEKVVASCVTIHTTDGHGSGIFISPNAILTAAHVAETATEAELFDGRRLRVVVARLDRLRDLALLRVEEPGVPLQLGVEPKPGDELFTVGCGNAPFGFNRGDCRQVYDHAYPTPGGEVAARCIDLSVPVNFGDSGAAVIFHGKIAGIVVGVDGCKNLTGFAVSVEELRRFIRE